MIRDSDDVDELLTRYTAPQISERHMMAPIESIRLALGWVGSSHVPLIPLELLRVIDYLCNL